MGYCSKEKKPCIQWVERYFKDCLCNLRDDVSFGFGIVSLVCWGVAEIPQIITNFYNKSGHGVSLAFLLTWVAGDVFNLVGCLLEPATLPTQFYTALLYTISTIVLVLQTVYYDHIRRWWKCRGTQAKLEVKEDDESFTPRRPPNNKSTSIPTASLKASQRRKGMYYTSARSLASSGTPPFGSYLGIAGSGPAAVMALSESSSDDDESRSTNAKSRSKPMGTARLVGYGTFVATSLSLPYHSKAFMERYMGSSISLLQEYGGESNAYGFCLGWLMAAIYVGGRVPQICLNIKRGSVQGLNPLMFIFALLANATYVASILVRSSEWGKIKANMPWLLDAIVCVVLDLFIIIQYMYYRFMHRGRACHEEDYGDYVEAKEVLVS